LGYIETMEIEQIPGLRHQVHYFLGEGYRMYAAFLLETDAKFFAQSESKMTGRRFRVVETFSIEPQIVAVYENGHSIPQEVFIE